MAQQPPSQQNTPNQSGWSFYDADYADRGSAPIGQAQPSHQSFAPGSAGASPRTRPAWLKWVAALLVVALLGGLGSSMLFATGGGGQTQPGQPTRSTPVVHPSPTPVPTPTATPQPTPQPTQISGQANTLPAGWTDSGRGVAEFYEAAEVAERFTTSYESLDWRSKNSFVGATFALTPSALARFNQQDERANPTFIAQFQQAEKIRRARVDLNQTRILQTEQRSDAFFAWILVDFSLYHQQKNKPAYTDTHSIVVLLISVPFGSTGIVGGVGWDVVGWKEGTAVFPIPQPAY